MKVKEFKEILSQKKEYSIGICAPITFAIVRISQYIDAMGSDFKLRNDAYVVLHGNGKGEPFMTAEDLLKEFEERKVLDDVTLLYEKENGDECYGRVQVYDGSKEIIIY